jgi:adenylate cyclase
MTSLPASSPVVVRLGQAPRVFVQTRFDAFARRFPFTGLIGTILVSNMAGSFFNFFYNTQFIVPEILDENQRNAFWNIAVPLYNGIAYPLVAFFFFYLLWPLMRCLRLLRGDQKVDAVFLHFCRRRLVNFPVVQIVLTVLGWLPGAIFFPWTIVAFGGAHNAGLIWWQFFVSFVVSTVFTTVQTFFLVQAFLTAYWYPEFFKDARPEAITGIVSVPFNVRLMMLWGAIALMPLVAVLIVAVHIPTAPEEFAASLVLLVILSAFSGGLIFTLVANDLRRWIGLQTNAMGEIATGNFDIRIDQPRPDEWGRLTNHFNDMATALNQAWESHETLGQLVSPEVRDEILHRMRGFEVHRQEITVLFVDIRGFTPRCAAETPERIGGLLNRFLTLALCSVEEKGGYVNKFLGDGVMALFGATRVQDDHADLALASALEMLDRLRDLNEELATQGQPPLVIGIGIHTGQALVGCFGAVLQANTGKPVMRREFTAIGETVNLCQRLEQLTKKCGGPILISDCTRRRLHGNWPLVSAGWQSLPGAAEPMLVHTLKEGI